MNEYVCVKILSFETGINLIQTKILIIKIQKIYLSVVFLKPKSVFCNIGLNSFKIKDLFDKKCAKSLQIFVRI